MVEGLDHVQLACPAGGEARAREFYGRVLGLPEIDKPPPLRSRGGVWFQCGAQQLHLGVEEPFAPARKAHPALRVATPADLDELASRLGPVEWDSNLPGHNRFFISDPFGNRLELLTKASQE